MIAGLDAHEDEHVDHPSLECPCCGDVAAEGDTDGRYFDGQALECGCAGHVSVSGRDDEVSITIADDYDPDVDCDDCSGRNGEFDTEGLPQA